MKKDNRKLVRLYVSIVKSRDFMPPEDFRIQLSPYLDTINDFAVVSEFYDDEINSTDMHRMLQYMRGLEAGGKKYRRKEVREAVPMRNERIIELIDIAIEAGTVVSDAKGFLKLVPTTPAFPTLGTRGNAESETDAN